MKYWAIFGLMLPPVISHAADDGCATVGSYMESSLLDALEHDLNIRRDTLQLDKTTVQVIDISPIAPAFTRQLAHTDYEVDKSRMGKALLSEKEYYSTFYDNHVQNLTAKYTYINKNGHRDVFIASSLMNEDECSVRFNGYLTLSREF